MLDQQKDKCIYVHDQEYSWHDLWTFSSSLDLLSFQSLQDLEKHLVQSHGSLEGEIGS